MAKKDRQTPTAKPSYLLVAEEPQFTRWRSAAKSSGSSSFADFARGALEVAAASPDIVPTGRFIGEGLVAIGAPCYSGDHRNCAILGCECSCHR